MAGLKLRTVMGAFAVLSTGVAGNLVMMQPSGSGVAATRPNIDRTAAKPTAERNRQQLTQATAEPATSNQTGPTEATAGKARADAGKPARPSAAASAAPAAPLADPPPSGPSELAAAVQRELNARGYEPGTPDGVPGLVTRAAIMAFEHDHNLALTGEPSEPLLRALQAGPATISAPAYATAAKDKRARVDLVVRTVQQSLAGLGYAPGKTSGRVNDETERAIKEFEMDQGMRVTGRISGPLVARLARAAGNGKLASGR